MQSTWSSVRPSGRPKAAVTCTLHRPLARSFFFFFPPSAPLELKVDTKHQHVHHSDALYLRLPTLPGTVWSRRRHDWSLQCVGVLPPTPAAGRPLPVPQPSQKALTRFAHSVHKPLRTFITPLYRSITSYILNIPAIAERLIKIRITHCDHASTILSKDIASFSNVSTCPSIASCPPRTYYKHKIQIHELMLQHYIKEPTTRPS